MNAPEKRSALRFECPSPASTEALAADLARRLPEGAVLALVGDLGAGKTTFVRGLALGLGVLDPVSSPTYARMHLYAGPRPLAHYDAWRVAGDFLAEGGAEGLAAAMGEGDPFAGPTGGRPAVVAVEWAENVAAWLPRPHLEVRFGPLSEGPQGRLVTLRVIGSGPAAEGLAAALASLGAPPGGSR